MGDDGLEDVLAGLREAADAGGLDQLRRGVRVLGVRGLREVVVLLLLRDAAMRAAEAAGAVPVETPPASPEVFAAALDGAAQLSAAVESIDDLDALLRATFAALTESDARFMAYEKGLRALRERRRQA